MKAGTICCAVLLGIVTGACAAEAPEPSAHNDAATSPTAASVGDPTSESNAVAGIAAMENQAESAAFNSAENATR